MYFGNTDGILEYDGLSWRLITMPNNSVVRSLSIDENGRIYVAASSDFGYLKPDSAGELKFISLLEYLDKKYSEFGDVWDVVTSSHGVYFKTRNKIFRWKNDRIKVFETVNAFRLYNVKDEVYVRSQGTGLLKITGDSLTLINSGDDFASTGVYDMLSFSNKILVSTTNQGLFLYDGNSFTEFKTEADSYLKENSLYNVCILGDNNIAIATMRGGVVILNKEGRLVRIINSKNGLISDVIYDVFPDKQGGLWLAMNEGISRIESSPTFIKILKSKTGNAFMSNLFRFHSLLYGANSLGIFYLDESTSTFKPLEGINSGNSFISVDNHLIATSNNSIYKIDAKGDVKKIFDYETPYLFKSPSDSNIIYVLYRIGLAVLQYNAGGFQVIKDSIPVRDEIVSLVEDNDGSLWINTFYEGVVQIKNYYGLKNKKNSTEIYRYGRNSGLPGTKCNIFSLNDKILFATDKGLFRFDSELKTFLRDSTLGKIFSDSTYFINAIEKNKSGDLWILAESKNGFELGKALFQNNEYYWHPEPAVRLLNLNKYHAIYVDYDPRVDKEFLWISTGEGLIRYDPEVNNNFNIGYNTLIRKVFINNDSLVYNGAEIDLTGKNIFLSGENNILFQFTAISYAKTESNLFQYYLEGNDEDWSQWTNEPAKGYTNLSSGDYIFHVRSKNVYGIIGNEDSFTFKILSPWYFSWWAYSIYGVIFLGMLYLIRRYEIKRLNKKHLLQLELVKYEKLKELDQLKSQFFANISHEFRTPLTLILGQIDSVMSSAVDTKEKGKLQVANRNARRLLTLINQLLDLSKIESGSMQLNASVHNIVSFLKSLFYSFESLAEERKITLKFETEYQNIPVSFDPDKMEKVFYNLISNALKFTKQGEVKVSITKTNTYVQIIIKDTGIGMNEDQRKHIFNRFYQADTSATREYEGTGIGLALTKELVELHKGNIEVISQYGKGTEFIISLPPGPEDKINVDSVAEDFSFESISNNSESVETNNDIQSQLSENKNEIILIVEDNSDVRAYIKEQLESNYIIIEASNGEEGIVQAQKEIPDLIITDVMMPKMDGYKFSSEIRCNEKTSHIPLIMLTAKAGLDDKIAGLETGIDAYLTKPFSAKELWVRVRTLIQQRKDLRKRFSTSTVIKPSEVSVVSADQKFIEKTIKIIEDNIENLKFGVEDLASECNMSVSQLSRKLNALVDQPAGHLIRSIRLQRAADYLKQNTGSIAEICYKVGFNDQAYFSRVFKKQFGCSPKEFKNQKPENSEN